MTSITMGGASPGTIYINTEPAELAGAQAEAPAPAPATATATDPAMTGSQGLPLPPPSFGTDPENLMATLQLWADWFEKDLVKATTDQIKNSNEEARANLKASLDKLAEAIKKMQEAKAAARKARTLGIILKVVAVVVAAAVIVGTGGSGAAAVVAGMAGAASMIDLGGEMHAARTGADKPFTLAGAVGGGWAGLMSANLAQTMVEAHKWHEKQHGRSVSDNEVIALTVIGTVAQLGLMVHFSAGMSSTSNAVRTAAGYAAASGAVVGGSLAISQGALTIESAGYQEEAENRRADSVEIDAQIKEIQRFIEDAMKHAEASQGQLQSATSIVAQLLQEWAAGMSNLALNSREKAAMA